MLLHTFVNNNIMLKIKQSNRDRRKCGCDAVKVEFLKQLRRWKTSIVRLFSDILEQSAITVVISHLNN